MGAVAPIKNERKAPITKVPSFVFRQDGCELSYEVGVIIAEKRLFVKNAPINPPPGESGWQRSCPWPPLRRGLAREQRDWGRDLWFSLPPSSPNGESTSLLRGRQATCGGYEPHPSFCFVKIHHPSGEGLDYPKKNTCFISGWAPVTGSISITITSFIYSFQRSTTSLSA